MRLILTLPLLLALLPTPALAQEIFGLKSCGFSTGTCGNTFPSEPPTSLYLFEEDGTSFATIGFVEVAGQPINADGLAMHPAYGLRAFELVGNPVQTSQIIVIESQTGLASQSGNPIAREIRGAAFDSLGQLWVLDSGQDEILQLDPDLGTTIGTPMSVTLAGNPFDVSSVSDIAFRVSGDMVMVNLNAFYSLDPSTGVLTNEFTDLVNDDEGGVLLSHAGVAVASDGSSLFAYDAAFEEDIFEYQFDYARAEIYSNIPPGYNAGRGDLASDPTFPAIQPVPSVAPLATGILLAALVTTASFRLLGSRRITLETLRSGESKRSAS